MTYQTHQAALAVALTLLAAPAFAQQANRVVDTGPFEGLYRPSGDSADSWSCDPNYLGQVGGALGVVDGYLEGAENRCELSNPRPAAGGRTEFTGTCSAEGSTYERSVILGLTDDGITLGPVGDDVRWTSCTGSSPVAASRGTWTFDGTSAVTVQQGMAFGLSCEALSASSTYTTARLSGYCPGCLYGETATFTIMTDQGFRQDFEFELGSQADGWSSGLDYYPNWFDGIVPALMSAGQMTVVHEGVAVASFNMGGSARSIEALRERCN